MIVQESDQSEDLDWLGGRPKARLVELTEQMAFNCMEIVGRMGGIIRGTSCEGLGVEVGEETCC